MLNIKQQALSHSNDFVSFNKQGIGVSRRYDDKWDFTSLGQVVKCISFTSIDEVHRANVQDVMSKILNDRKDKSLSDSFAVSTLDNTLSSLKSVVRYWGNSDFSLLSHDREWSKLKSKIKGRYSRLTLRQIGIALNQLVTLGVIDEQYFSEEDCKSLADPNAVSKQHIGLPVNIHAKILTQVYGTVEKYHPHRHVISELMKKGFEQLDIERKIELDKGVHEESSRNFRKNVDQRTFSFINRLGRENGIPDFKYRLDGYWLKKLMTDCAMCVVFFSGVRKSELLKASSSSYKVGPTDIPILELMHSKPNGGIPIKTIWQTDPIAKKALELAFDSSDFARKFFLEQIDSQLSNGQISLDQHESNKKELNCAFIKTSLAERSIGRVVESYLMPFEDGFVLERFGIEATKDDVEEFDLLNPDREGEVQFGGSLPKLSLHDLRRSFAVFLVRNKLGNHLTVKFQLKHKNLQMSKWYANYAELARDRSNLLDGNLFDEINRTIEDACVDALDDIYNHSTELSGVEGERISKNKFEKLQKGEQIYLSREELRGLLRKGKKSVVILPTGGYCTSPRCERLCSIGVIPEHKKDCGLVTTDKGAKRLARERSGLIKAFRDMNNLNDSAFSTLLSGHKKKILLMEKTLERHNISFERFTDKIKA